MTPFAIRIKVKHVLVLLFIIGAGMIASAQIGTEALLTQAMEAYAQDERERALILFDRYLERCGTCTGVPEALFHSALLLTSTAESHSYVFSTGRRSWPSNPEPPLPLPTAADRLLRLVYEYPDFEWTVPSIPRLMDLLPREGRWDELEEALAFFRGQRPAFARPQLILYQSEVALRRGDYDRAIDLSEQFLASGFPVEQIEAMLVIGDAHLRLGHHDAAEESYDRARRFATKDSPNELRRILLREPNRPTVEQALALREHWLHRATRAAAGEGGSITGRVTGFAGDSRGIEIMAGRQSEFGTTFPPRPGTYEAVMTDGEGNFRFDGLAPGVYVVAMRYTSRQKATGYIVYDGPSTVSLRDGDEVEVGFRALDPVHPQGGDSLARLTADGLKIAWAPVPGATRYVVRLGSVSRFEGSSASVQGVVTETTDTEVILDPTVVRWTHLAGGIGYHGGGEIHDDSLLGPIYPGSETFIFVDAYDPSYIDPYDERGLIASSRSGELVWQADSALVDTSALGTLSPAERLVQEGRFEEAIDGLKKQIEANPEDLTSLMVLYRIYVYGTDTDKTHRDAEAARSLRQRILATGVDSEIVQVLQGLFRGMESDDRLP